MHTMMHAMGLDRRRAHSPERVRNEAAGNAGATNVARAGLQTVRPSEVRSLPKSIRSGPVQRVEHALFAVVLLTVGYVYLGALLAEAL
jgi:hypothetical protein